MPGLTRRSFLATLGAAGVIVAAPRGVSHSAPANSAASVDALAASFRTPPQACNAWVYWWWLDGAVTREGITADLEAMQRQGIGGVLLFDAGSGGAGAPQGPTFMSSAWRDNFRHAMAEAARLKLELSVNLCSGWNAGGPWVTRDDAIKHLVWQETVIEGGKEFHAELPRYRERPGEQEPPSISSTEDPTSIAEDEPTDWYRDIAVLACAEEPGGVWRIGGIHDLTPQLSDGRLRWQAPKGTWTVLRIGCLVPQFDEENGDASIRTKNRSAKDPGAWEIDPMSAEAMERHFAETGAKLLDDAGALAGTTLKYLHVDSWEIGIPTWTLRFPAEFASRRKYDPLRYLPSLAGKVVESPEITARFIWDYRRTVADLVAANYYGRLAQLAHERGVGTHPEAGGPWYTQYVDALECLGTNDIPMAEFWSSRGSFVGTERSPGLYAEGVSADFFRSAETALPSANFGSIKQAATAAHIYGKPLCQGEAFTNFNADWTEDPYFLKSYGDRALCLGLTRNVLCFYVSQSSLTDKPGYEWEHTGLHIDRNVTWWEKSSAWLRYLARCQYLLRRGRFCADLLYFSGETIPNFVLRDRKPIDGYDYDVINAEALLARAQAKDGQVVLPDGVSYRYLIIPPGAADSMTAAVARKLQALVEAGVTLIGAAPKRSLGLTDYPRSQREVEAIAHDLWGEQSTSSARRVGEGRVIGNSSVSELIKSDGLLPDLQARGVPPGVDLDWIHRREAAGDIYFIANLSETQVDTDVAFRVSGRAPELWDAVTGTVRELEEFHVESGCTVVPLRFDPKQSLFIVFRQAAVATRRQRRPNVPALRQIAEIDGPWQVSFDPKWGGPQSVTFARLDDWSKRPEHSIRYYSGTATYRHAFQLTDSLGELYLALGTVKNVAQVRVNGHDAGIVWTAPWRVGIKEFVRRGKNELEIEVVNLWPNRLIGDSQLPADRRFTKTNVGTYATPLPEAFFCAWERACEDRKKSRAPAALLSSGLLGPVAIWSGG